MIFIVITHSKFKIAWVRKSLYLPCLVMLLSSPGQQKEFRVYANSKSHSSKMITLSYAPYVKRLDLSELFLRPWLRILAVSLDLGLTVFWVHTDNKISNPVYMVPMVESKIFFFLSFLVQICRYPFAGQLAKKGRNDLISPKALIQSKLH